MFAAVTNPCCVTPGSWELNRREELFQRASSHPLHWQPSPAASACYPCRQMQLVVLFCDRWKAVRARAEPALQHSTGDCKRVTCTSEVGMFLRYKPCAAPCPSQDLTWCLTWCLLTAVHRGQAGNKTALPVDRAPSVVGTGHACFFSRSRYRPPATMLLHFNVTIPRHIHANLCLGSGTPVSKLNLTKARSCWRATTLPVFDTCAGWA